MKSSGDAPSGTVGGVVGVGVLVSNWAERLFSFRAKAKFILPIQPMLKLRELIRLLFTIKIGYNHATVNQTKAKKRVQTR